MSTYLGQRSAPYSCLQRHCVVCKSDVIGLYSIHSMGLRQHNDLLLLHAPIWGIYASHVWA